MGMIKLHTWDINHNRGPNEPYAYDRIIYINTDYILSLKSTSEMLACESRDMTEITTIEYIYSVVEPIEEILKLIKEGDPFA